jgi:hypothetical protein
MRRFCMGLARSAALGAVARIAVPDKEKPASTLAEAGVLANVSGGGYDAGMPCAFANDLVSTRLLANPFANCSLPVRA